jgi:hypothetical protein
MSNFEDGSAYNYGNNPLRNVTCDAYVASAQPYVNHMIATDYIYTRDSTGTVVGISTTFNVPRHQLVYVETRHAISGVVFHSELRFKKDVEKYFTHTWEPHPDYPHVHFDRDENTTTHFLVLE